MKMGFSGYYSDSFSCIKLLSRKLEFPKREMIRGDIMPSAPAYKPHSYEALVYSSKVTFPMY